MNTIEINVPYTKRHLTGEIKLRGGKFQSDQKNWILPNTTDNQALKEMVERRVAAPSQAERLKNVLALSIELLNALKHRTYIVVETGDRIVIESVPLVVASKPVTSESSMVIS